jgi:hypothetical protein
VTWQIIVQPEGKNGVLPSGADQPASGETVQGENQTGMVIYLTEEGTGSAKREISRVGFVRRNTKNPKVKFDDQLEKELGKARKSRDLLNSLAENAGVLQ